ncbi:MAG: prepilin-type N-terminal cleavage/methylation domain-containing protein [Deltaproteobacteria bacterium]|nr:prepilin-type N-terminal cleavage/methylation domain-containing protein [Deltaproteobacteria bacterium]
MMKQRGFTLIELMVAIFVGAIVIAGIFVIFTNSQKIFHQEGRISQAQLGARIGMELLKSDIRRAAYLSSPNPGPHPVMGGRNVDPLVCFNQGVTGLDLQPVVHTNGTDGKVFNTMGAPVDIPYPAQNIGLRPDSVILVGNYINANAYLAQTISASTGAIRLQTIQTAPPPGMNPASDSWSSRDTIGDNEFQRMFPSTAFVRVVNRHGRMMFARITGADFANMTVNVSASALKQVGEAIQCGIPGYGEGSEVNVVNAILYRVEIDPSPEAVDYADGNKRKKSDLVRYMLDQNMNVLRETREVVIEHVVDFQLWYRQDDPIGALGSRPNIDMDWQSSLPDDRRIVIGIPIGASPPPLDGSVNAHPENLRSAIIKISVRTADEDTEFSFLMRGLGDPLHRFELNPVTAGAAHIRTLVTEVKLPNIAFRNLRN